MTTRATLLSSCRSSGRSSTSRRSLLHYHQRQSCLAHSLAHFPIKSSCLCGRKLSNKTLFLFSSAMNVADVRVPSELYSL
ncbi:hypothetical protein GLYMA_07G160150v4 [Glycine max]|nr:hypothetical protein GLYMA_07G160150v4 [Glycine max]KAH1087095.1 hypothetical protein GYH30_018570 [Glycine max]